MWPCKLLRVDVGWYNGLKGKVRALRDTRNQKTGTTASYFLCIAFLPFHFLPIELSFTTAWNTHNKKNNWQVPAAGQAAQNMLHFHHSCLDSLLPSIQGRYFSAAESKHLGQIASPWGSQDTWATPTSISYIILCHMWQPHSILR